MNEHIAAFLRVHRVCALAVLLPDGVPHVSAMHFSHRDDPLVLFFSTDRGSRKCEGLLEGRSAKASVALGFDETQMKTLQMDGEIRAVTDPDELAAVQAIHYAKHPQAQQYKGDPDTLFLMFTPTWWRYSDYQTDPVTIVSG